MKEKEKLAMPKLQKNTNQNANMHYISDTEIKIINKVDYNDLCDERKHMENLLVDRFNFFITFFSVILAGTVASLGLDICYTSWIAIIILTIGFIICWLIKLTIIRCQLKLNIILSHLPDNHPNNEVNNIIEEARKKKKNKSLSFWDRFYIKTKSQKNIIGYVIPNICCIILLILIICGCIFL